MTIKALFPILGLVILFSSCSKQNTDNPSSSSGYYYEATIGGVTYKETVTNSNGYIAGSTGGANDDAIFGSSIAPIAEPIPANETALGIGKGIFHNFSDETTDAEFKSFFNPGTYSFSTPGSYQGITVSWMDKSGNYWSTDNDPATQSGSTFTITKVNDGPVSLNQVYYVEVTATFNCTLYDLSGNSKQLTNGKYFGLFGKIR
ncbi:hypothetical protein [Ferruginibacter albus]|uniref:hypothetical protein n=1 Tax=Ferruginibacter albus TaxID=2875540 RepID=UPI001CC6C6C6|nr:hypothetical protein [Ferruginibacter albus]UAY51939.1 hypothetical protein K9M53_15275 [Ferruginibacter albus]